MHWGNDITNFRFISYTETYSLSVPIKHVFNNSVCDFRIEKKTFCKIKILFLKYRIHEFPWAPETGWSERISAVKSRGHHPRIKVRILIDRGPGRARGSGDPVKGSIITIKRASGDVAMTTGEGEKELLFFDGYETFCEEEVQEPPPFNSQPLLGHIKNFIFKFTSWSEKYCRWWRRNELLE